MSEAFDVFDISTNRLMQFFYHQFLVISLIAFINW